MPVLYRTELEIDAALGDVEAAILEWIESLHLSDDHQAQVWRGDIDQVTALTILVTFREHWTIDVQVAQDGVMTFLDASVHSKAQRRRTSLPLIERLIERFSCRLDLRTVRNEATRVNESSLRQFMEETFMTTSRLLPLVGISENFEGKTPLDPDALQRKLAGTAHVAVWHSATSLEIVKELGRHSACYNGAVRIYRPRPSPADDRERHPFFLWSRACKPGFGQELLERVVEQALNVDPSSRVAGIVARVQQEERNATAIARPSEEIDRLRATVDARDDEIARLKEQLDQAARFMAGEIHLEANVGEVEPETVAEAVQLAESECEMLEFFQSARDEAAESRYPQAVAVLGALRGLNTLAGRLSEGTTSEEGIVPWLRGANLDISSESVDTMHRYGDQRMFRDEFGRLVEMQLHIKLGGGLGQDSRCRIHFRWNATASQIQVGHVGRHLQTSQS